ncbi:class I SAM-dependent rRNA methyltransferase [Sulfurisoma sediminicola]|uniref:23S rRNA (Cytosine1962-C5)-methyltransferase n=1 Tax=Sulfurisoma sediminicola TaxID=1381557 RepID=A0A497XKM9_9PROT|nr:class I SAM-dependent methyltransferase [Sulfurisoma sediminicola]RLJ68501.1 23S rRNA (cytosine1962-C5)-methyltransferase [Sulfurisoma sediminicola]
MSAQLILQAGKEKSLLRHHPWIFAGSVAGFEGRARPGDTVDVVAGGGRYAGQVLAKAAWSPASQIRARVWSFDPTETVDHAFFKRRIAAAVARRAALPELAGQDGVRLIHAESDGLPGLIADRYGDTVVIQLTSAGTDKWRTAIADGLHKATGCARIYDRSDSEVRAREGLEPQSGWLLGEGDSRIVIDEHGVRIAVDVATGHKTGFYLDQRENRLMLRGLSAGRRVLNCYCYTGGFSLQALAGGAREVISVDSSAPALTLAAENLALNPGLDAVRAEWLDANVAEELRRRRDANETFDLIVLDPPKFAPSAAHVERASRAYKDINLNAFKLLAPGGLLMTYSCSGGIGAELFQQIVAGAALDARRDAAIVKRLQGAADHPVALTFPEGEYLKGLLVQVA